MDMGQVLPLAPPPASSREHTPLPLSAAQAHVQLQACVQLGLRVSCVEADPLLGLCVFGRCAGRFQVLRVDWEGRVAWEASAVEEMRTCVFTGVAAGGLEAVGVTNQGRVLLLHREPGQAQAKWRPVPISFGAFGDGHPFHGYTQGSFLLDQMTPRKTFGITLGNGKLLRVPKVGSSLNICVRPFLKNFALLSSLDYTRCYFSEEDSIGVFHVLRRKVMLKIKEIRDGDLSIRFPHIKSIKAISPQQLSSKETAGVVCVLGTFVTINQKTMSFDTIEALVVLSASLRKVLFKLSFKTDIAHLLSSPLNNQATLVVAVSPYLGAGSSPEVWNPQIECLRISKATGDEVNIERITVTLTEAVEKGRIALDPDAPQITKCSLVPADASHTRFKLLCADNRGHVGVHFINLSEPEIPKLA